jgi:protocatechuate 3,4-dioxygenase beta subunit
MATGTLGLIVEAPGPKTRLGARVTVFAALWLAMSFVSADVQTQTEDSYRELSCQVVDEQKQPVAGIEVLLLGRDRDAVSARFDRQYFEERGDKYHGWTFRTDEHGRFVARFGKFQQDEHQQTSHVVEPGYGEFHLLVQKEGHAGGVSARIVNLKDEDRSAHKPSEYTGGLPQPGEEWEGNELLLSDEPKAEPLQIVLREGIEVSGRLLDPQNRPIPNETVNLWNDLGADTHTGRGNEILERQATTDRDGRFRFHHVYPNMFYLALENEDSSARDSLYWIKTRIRKRWVDGIADAIWPHAGEADLPLIIVAAREPPYRYFGKVSDEQGKPIAGAKVRIQASLHGPLERQDFADSHDHHSETITRQDGSYELRAAGPYVNWFEVTARGFGETMYNEDGEIEGFNLYEEVPGAPGRYDFVLKRK